MLLLKLAETSISKSSDTLVNKQGVPKTSLGYAVPYLIYKLMSEIEEITEGQAHANTQKLYQDISTGTAVFINRKRVNVCEHTTKMASLESL